MAVHKTIRTTSNGIFCLHVPFDTMPLKIALLSDVHIGSAGFERMKHRFVRALKTAHDAGAFIMFNGDLFDAIFHADVRRYAPWRVAKSVRDAEAGIDAMVGEAAEMLRPFAERIVLFNTGNHELEAMKRYGVNMLVRLANEVSGGDGKIAVAPYEGFVLFNGDKSTKKSNSKSRLVVYFHHGWGMSGKSGGVLHFNTALEYLGTVDVVWMGHLHLEVERVNRQRMVVESGGVSFRPVVCVRTGTFLGRVEGDWSTTRGYPPPEIGGKMLVFDKEIERGTSAKYTWVLKEQVRL